MRRTVTLSLTTVWLILGIVFNAMSQGKTNVPHANLKAVSFIGGVSSPELVLRIEGDYTYQTTRAMGNTVWVDLRNVKATGLSKDGKLQGSVVSEYHLLQYSAASSQPIVRVQLDLRQAQTLRALREATGLRLIFTPVSEAAPVASGSTEVAPVASEARSSSPGSAMVSAVNISASPTGETYVDISTSSPAQYKVLRLHDPPRLVVDLEGVKHATLQKAYPSQAPFIKGIRVGQFRDRNPSVVRVVADLSGEPSVDVHARTGGVRMELKSKPVIKSLARSVPTSAGSGSTSDVEARPAEKIQVPRPSEILNTQAEPSPATLNRSPRAPTQTLTPVEKSIPNRVEVQKALPAPVSSRDVAAVHKLQTPPTPPEAIHAARAAMTMANTPGVIAAALQEQPAASAQEQQPKYTGEPISLNLKDVDLKDFFRLIHEISGLNIIVDPNVTGNVTLVLDAVPWDQALDIVLKNNRLGKTLEGNVLRIARVETLTAEQEAATKLAAAREEAQPLVTEFRPVNYAKASTISTMLKSWVGGGALSKRGNILVDDRTNTLIISDIQSQIPIIESIINRLDKKAKQVSIEARIILAKATFSRNLGVSISAAYNNLSGSTTMAGGTGTASTANSAGQTPLVTVQPVSGFGVYAITNAGARYIINAAIAAEETRGLAKTISKPTIVTQNNVPGTVVQGTQIPIQTSINNTVTIQYYPAALTMKVTPQVTEDGNIFLDINVTNAAPGLVLTTAGPSIDTQQATTQVLVPDGGTVVFGGVNVTGRTKSATYVPVIGSIPILGHLFKTSGIQDTDQELLFFVSPKVLPG